MEHDVSDDVRPAENESQLLQSVYIEAIIRHYRTCLSIEDWNRDISVQSNRPYYCSGAETLSDK